MVQNYLDPPSPPAGITISAQLQNSLTTEHSAIIYYHPLHISIEIFSGTKHSSRLGQNSFSMQNNRLNRSEVSSRLGFWSTLRYLFPYILCGIENLYSAQQCIYLCLLYERGSQYIYAEIQEHLPQYLHYEMMENIGFVGSHCENQLFYKTPDLPHSMASLQSHKATKQTQNVWRFLYQE